MLTKAPSDSMKLLTSFHTAIGTVAEDLATYIDHTGYEYLLVCLISGKLTGETGTDVTMEYFHGDASNGSGAVAAKGVDGTDISQLIGGSAAAGLTLSFCIRTHGLKKYGSPKLVATGAAVTCSCAVYGFNPKDNADLTAHWTDEVSEITAGATVN